MVWCFSTIFTVLLIVPRPTVKVLLCPRVGPVLHQAYIRVRRRRLSHVTHNVFGRNRKTTARRVQRLRVSGEQTHFVVRISSDRQARARRPTDPAFVLRSSLMESRKDGKKESTPKGFSHLWSLQFRRAHTSPDDPKIRSRLRICAMPCCARYGKPITNSPICYKLLLSNLLSPFCECFSGRVVVVAEKNHRGPTYHQSEPSSLSSTTLALPHFPNPTFSCSEFLSFHACLHWRQILRLWAVRRWSRGGGWRQKRLLGGSFPSLRRRG